MSVMSSRPWRSEFLRRLDVRRGGRLTGAASLPQGGSQSRRPALDGIRALAFFGVLADHLRLPYLRGGGIGVNVFFVLSGFLITGILLAERERTGRISLPRFYARRAARLLPALFVLVATFTAYALLVQRANRPSAEHMGATSLYVIAYVANWVRAFRGQNSMLWFGHTWSLSIEEQFYLLWPLCLIVALRWRGVRTVLLAALVGSTLAFVARVVLWHGASSVDRIYNGTDTNADQLLVGCALAAALALWPDLVRRACRVAWLPGVAALLLLTATDNSTSFWRMTIGYTLVAVATAVVIGFVWCEPASALARLLSNRVLVATGLISYGLYLWHFPILLAVEGHVHSLALRTLVVTSTTFVAAYGSWRFVERPVQRWVRSRQAAGKTMRVPEPLLDSPAVPS
jgi:peptidoglycan/LPS O-acetylase OafA/YrhL